MELDAFTSRLGVGQGRIVAADGRMTGFSGPGGIKTKLRLLALEGAELFAE